MIICARNKNYDDIKAWLTPEDKIIIMTCNICIKGCGIGGHRLVDRLAKKLQKDGYNVIYKGLVGFACNQDLIYERRDHPFTKDIFAEATAIIPIACGEGIHNFTHIFSDKKVFNGIVGLGVGSVSAKEGPKLILPFPETIEKLKAANVELPPTGIKLKEVAAKLNLEVGGF